MRLTTPLPEKDELAGDPDVVFNPPPPVNYASAAWVPPGGQKMLGAEEAGVRVRELYKQGFSKRAVVCSKGVDCLNPVHWGFVTEVHAFWQTPLEVHWTSGHKSWTNGDDLVVIYRGQSAKDLKIFLNAAMATRQ